MPNGCLVKILFLLFFFLNASIDSKDFDSILEKPFEKKKVNKHQFFIREMYGRGQMTSPIEEEKRGRSFVSTIASIYANENDLYSTQFSARVPANPYSRDFEYRYYDNLRFFKETRFIQKNQSYLFSIGTSSSSLPLAYTDEQSRIGISYFYPFFEFVSLGVSLRDVKLTQKSVSQITSTLEASTSSTGLTYLSDNSTVTKYKGFVPGIGVEYKPLSWFEIHFNHLFFDLKGKERATSTDLYFFQNRSLAVVEWGEGNVTYSGYSQTLDFIFRYSSWFCTKWGFTNEGFLKQNSVFFANSLVRNPANNLLTSLVTQKLTEASVKFTSINITFEFSKGFD